MRTRRLNKARTTAENNTAKHADLVKVTESMKRNLEQEMAGVQAELRRQEQVGGGVGWGFSAVTGSEATGVLRQDLHSHRFLRTHRHWLH